MTTTILPEFVCARGHIWQIDGESAGRSEGERPRCPVCGGWPIAVDPPLRGGREDGPPGPSLAPGFVAGATLSVHLRGEPAPCPDRGRGRRDARPRRPRGAPAGLPPRRPHRRQGRARTDRSPAVRGPRAGPSLRGEWSRADPQDHGRSAWPARPGAGRDPDSSVRRTSWASGRSCSSCSPASRCGMRMRSIGGPPRRAPGIPRCRRTSRRSAWPASSPTPARRLADAGLLADALRQFLDTFVTQFQCSRCSKAIKSKKPLRVGTTVVRCPRCGAQSLVEPFGREDLLAIARAARRPARTGPGRRDPGPQLRREPEPARRVSSAARDRPHRHRPRGHGPDPGRDEHVRACPGPGGPAVPPAAGVDAPHDPFRLPGRGPADRRVATPS